MIPFLRELWLFFRRDLYIAKSYRSPFIMEIVQALFGTATFYYVARFVESPELRQTLPQSGGYFAFSLVGFVFLDYLNAALDTFDRGLEEARTVNTVVFDKTETLTRGQFGVVDIATAAEVTPEEALRLEDEGKERASVEKWRELFGWRMPRR